MEDVLTVSRFGVPSTITTDRGRQFESSLCNKLMTLLGTTRIRTTAYQPIANGMVERFHRTLKASLKAQHNTFSWTISLAHVLLSLRATVKQDIKCTPADLTYGSPLRLPGELFDAKPTSPCTDPTECVVQPR